MTAIANAVTYPDWPPQAERDELIHALAGGEIGFHQLPDHHCARDRTAIRRAAIEQRTGARLDHMGHYSLDAESVANAHCENMIGCAQVPIGVIGPLRIRGQYVADDELMVPLATTEGALVASANRGCRALREAGGAVVRVENVGITRAPVFRTAGIVESLDFIRWIRENEDQIRRRLEAQSRFLRLLEIRPQALGTTVFLRFRCDAGDAMGMNMLTIALDRVIAEYIEPETGVECVSLSGNYCVDKKPAAINFIEVPAAVRDRVEQRVLRETLRVIEGQCQELAISRSGAGFAQYLRAAEGKTGSFLSLPLTGAAALCGLPPQVEDGLAAASRHLGVLFQIQDDLVDLWGEKGRGCPGNDIREGKPSVLVVYCRERSTAAETRWLDGILGKPRHLTTDAEVAAVIAFFERCGARTFALAEIERRHQAAMSVAQLVNHPTLRRLIAETAEFFRAPVAALAAVPARRAA